MRLNRAAKIHPLILLILGFGLVAGVYVQYKSYTARTAAEIEKEEAENRQGRGLGAASEMLVKNPRPERTRPLKYVFSDTAPTRSDAGKRASVEVTYPEEISTAEKFGTRDLEIMLDGVKHFRETNSFNKKAIVGETADLMIEIIESMHVGLGANLLDYRERLSPILIDPQVSGDPYFQYLAGLVHVETGEDAKAEELFFGSVFDHTKYDYPSRYVLLSCNKSLENGLERNIHSKIHERAADAIVGWLKYDFDESPEDHRFVWATLSKTIKLLAYDDKLDYVKKVLDLNESDAFIPAWLETMMRGKYYAMLATADEEADEQKTENAKLAVECFEKAMKLNGSFPESYAELILVSKLDPDSDKGPSDWAELAQQKGFDDYGIQRSMIESFETPEEMMDFGVKCFESGKFDTAIPFALVGAYQRVQDSVNDPENAKGKEQLKKVVDCLGKLASDPTPKYIGTKKVSFEWLLSAQAAIAVPAGENEAAAKAFAALGDKFDKNVLKTFPGLESVSKARVRVSSLASGSADRIDRIENLLEKLKSGEDHTDAIRKEVDDAMKTVKGSKVYFESIGAFLKAYGVYEEAETTKLGFGNGMLLWESETEGQVDVASPDSIVISTLGGKDHALLMSTYHTPGPKTIELDLEFVSQNDPCAAEIVFGGWRDYGDTGVVTINGPGKRVGFGSTAFNGNIAKFKFNATDETNAVRVNVADGYAELFVNDHFVMRSTSSRIEANGQIGLGLNGYGTMRGKVKFENVRVKKWEAAPSIADGDLVAHYVKVTKETPEDPYGWFFRGLAEYKNKNYSAAAEHLDRAVGMGVPEIQAAPFVGDIADREGDDAKARIQYRIVFDAMEERPAEILQTGDKNPAFDHFQVAAARYLWNELIRHDLDIKERIELVRAYDDAADGNSPLGSSVGWISNRLTAQVRATSAFDEKQKGDKARLEFEEATKVLKALQIKEGFADSNGELKKKGAASKRSGDETKDGKEEKEKSQRLLNAERDARQAEAKMKSFERRALSAKRLGFRAIEKAIDGADEKFAEELTALKTCLEEGKLFTQKSSSAKTERPSYLEGDDMTAFPILRDLLREEWQAFYK